MKSDRDSNANARVQSVAVTNRCLSDAGISHDFVPHPQRRELRIIVIILLYTSGMGAHVCTLSEKLIFVTIESTEKKKLSHIKIAIFN